MEFVARTDIGKTRTENQDSVCVFAHAGFLVGIVADGMGGHKGGSTASSIAVACAKSRLLAYLDADMDLHQAREILSAAYTEANERIYALSDEDKDLEGMGTTLTIAVLKAGELLVANIGDSRAYILDEASIRQLTVDQTLVQRLLDGGLITPQEAKTHPHRNVILEAVGTSETISPEFYTETIGANTVLLCSDGLCGVVDEAYMFEILQSAPSPAQAADCLIAAANADGGPDNITVALLSVEG